MRPVLPLPWQVLKSLRAIQSLAPDLLAASHDLNGTASGKGAQSTPSDDSECSAAEWVQQLAQLSARLQQFEHELNADLSVSHS